MNIIVTPDSQLIELLTRIVRLEVSPLREMLSSKRENQESIPDILNVQQTSKMLNLAPSTIYGLVNKSKLPHYKKGAKLRFKRSQLLEWIDSGEKKTQDQIEREVKIHTRKPSKF